MIEYEKAERGDIVYFYKIPNDATPYKKIVPPVKVIIDSIMHGALVKIMKINYFIELVDNVADKPPFGVAEKNVHSIDKFTLILGNYYKSLQTRHNSIPRKIRKAIKKYSEKYPEYSI